MDAASRRYIDGERPTRPPHCLPSLPLHFYQHDHFPSRIEPAILDLLQPLKRLHAARLQIVMRYDLDVYEVRNPCTHPDCQALAHDLKVKMGDLTGEEMSLMEAMWQAIKMLPRPTSPRYLTETNAALRDVQRDLVEGEPGKFMIGVTRFKLYLEMLIETSQREEDGKKECSQKERQTKSESLAAKAKRLIKAPEAVPNRSVDQNTSSTRPAGPAITKPHPVRLTIGRLRRKIDTVDKEYD